MGRMQGCDSMSCSSSNWRAFCNIFHTASNMALTLFSEFADYFDFENAKCPVMRY